MSNYLDRDRRPITPLATRESRTSWYRRPHVASSIGASAVAVFAVGLATTGIYNREVDASSVGNSVPKAPETSLVQPTPSPEPPTVEPEPKIQLTERTPMLDELESLAEESIIRIREKALQYPETSDTSARGGRSEGSVYQPIRDSTENITGFRNLQFDQRRTDLNLTRDLEYISGTSILFERPLPPDHPNLEGDGERVDAYFRLEELPDGNWRFGTGSADIPEGVRVIQLRMTDTAFSTLSGDTDSTSGIVFTSPTPEDVATFRETLTNAIDQM